MKSFLLSARIMLTIILSVSILSSFAQTTFYYTGAVQTYTVPAGITVISVDVRGAGGGSNSDSASIPDRGGYGGRVQALLTVTPGMLLNIYVGDSGGKGQMFTAGAGGYNGGANGGLASWGYSGGGGGGASDIRIGGTALTDRVIIGGGGGGAGLECASLYYLNGEKGGDGGNLTGQNGGDGCYYDNGFGGTQAAGGAGGYNIGSLPPYPGAPGSLGSGGWGGTPMTTGGGGGGGYYGGGGGDDGGGGGGSSYMDTALVISQVFTQGYNAGKGLVIIDTVICTGPPTVTPILGLDTVCVPGRVLYTNATPGGFWSIINTNAFIAPDGLVTGWAVSMDTIIYTASNACGTKSDSMVITIDSLPLVHSISGSFSICKADSVTLNDSSAGGTWSAASTGIITVGSGTGIVDGILTGTAMITYTVPSGCMATAMVTVNPNPTFITGAATICTGSTYVLNDVTTGGIWISSNSAIASINAVTGHVTGVAAGTVNITYSLPTGCYAERTITVNSCTTGITQMQADSYSMNIAPNPNNGAFTINGSLGTSNDEAVSLEITNLTGQVVYKNTITSINGSIYETIKLNNTIPDGIYILNLRSETANRVYRIEVRQ